MKRLIRFIAKMYPESWRERYGEEFQALLDDTHTDGRIALDVLQGALRMRSTMVEPASVALVAMAALVAASWWVGQRPYLTPGTHQIFRMDTNLGFLVEFLVLVAVLIVGAITLLAGRGRWICVGIAASYMGAVAGFTAHPSDHRQYRR